MVNDQKAKVKSISLEAKIIRASGEVEDLGTISYWHRNPLVRMTEKLKRKIKKWLT